MRGFALDISDLEKKLDFEKKEIDVKDVSIVPYAHNHQKFVKKAFDMFQSKFDNTIWELVEEAGSKYLVKRTDLDEDKISTTGSKINHVAKISGHWSVASVNDKFVTLHFLSIPIRKFTNQKFAFDNSTIELFASHLLETVKTNKNVAKRYVKSADTNAKKMLLKRCNDDLIDDDIRLVYTWIQNEDL